MPLNLPALTEENVTLEPSLTTEELSITISGVCDGFVVGALGAYLNDVLDELSRLDLRQVAFDIQALKVLNSSCLKQFISFLHRVRSDETLRRVHFIVDPELPWQRRSLRALARMCPGIVKVISAKEGSSVSKTA